MGLYVYSLNENFDCEIYKIESIRQFSESKRKFDRWYINDLYLLGFYTNEAEYNKLLWNVLSKSLYEDKSQEVILKYIFKNLGFTSLENRTKINMMLLHVFEYNKNVEKAIGYAFLYGRKEYIKIFINKKRHRLIYNEYEDLYK